MSETPPQVTGETQGKRRLKYGLNVAVGIVAALAIVVFINWIGYRQVHRFDFTSTRRYTLSPQTLTVLKEMKEPYKIVTLLDRPNPNEPGAGEEAMRVNNTNELIDEYARYGTNLTVEHIDPDVDLAPLKDFYATLMARYADRLKPQQEAVQAARKTLESLRKPTADLSNDIAKLVNNPELPEGDVKAVLREITQAFDRIRDQEDKSNDQKLDQQLDSPMPNYSAVITSLKTLLDDRNDKVFGVIENALTRYSQSPSLPLAVKQTLLSLAKEVEPIRVELGDALNQLREVKPVDDYDKLLSQLDQRNIVVILSSKQEAVVPLAEMYRPMSEAQALEIRNSGGIPEPMFQGEERLTGALISLGMKEHPLVVFVYSGGAPPLSSRGGYTQVADRLRKLNFEVSEWTPVSQPGPMGQPMAPIPPPQPRLGQKAVWIILPLAMPNPVVDPTAGSGNPQIVKLLEDRLNAGDAALVMVAYTGPTMGESSPLLDYLSPWGISVQTDRMVMHEVVEAQKAPHGDTQLLVDQWSSDLPITKALAGMRGIFAFLSPLQLDPKTAQKNGVDLWPLVQFQGADMWAERNVNMNKPGGVTKDPATAGGPFIAMVAAARHDTRLIVVGDPYWATDQITTYGVLGEGSADLTGALFPGNSELFVDDIYWLSGLDRLIAASARSQDIRRIEPIHSSSLMALELTLLGGMPLAVAAAGVLVWMIRRRA